LRLPRAANTDGAEDGIADVSDHTAALVEMQ
jgi:hypothetical protein